MKSWSTILTVVAVCSLSHLDAVPLKSQTGIQNSTNVFESNSTAAANTSVSNYIGEFILDDSSLRDDEILFEGDIRITIPNLLKYYEINETELRFIYGNRNATHVSKRGTTSDEGLLWNDHTIPYVISSCFSDSHRQEIIKAMRDWSEVTCLKFVERQPEHNDYVRFERGMVSNSYVGRQGSMQIINLSEYGVSNIRTILHEIGHAVGVWHEQSRPDRDCYVTVNDEKIVPGKQHNFKKREENRVDYQGTEYDYRSVMHYRRKAFLRYDCPNGFTIDINNYPAYERQGEPDLGRENELSPIDFIQVNRLYKCPGPGQKGFLRLYIRYGINFNLPRGSDFYVKIRAVDSYGREDIKQTTCSQGNVNPFLNQELLFRAAEWQFFRFSVWDDSLSLGLRETVPLLEQPSSSTCHEYCTDKPCDTYIRYNYELLPLLCGRLRVKVRYARDLPINDQLSYSYVHVGVLQPDLSHFSRGTIEKRGTRNPEWNIWFSMNGCSFADHITVQTFYGNDRSEPEMIHIRLGYNYFIKHCVRSDCNSYLMLDTEFIPNICERTLSIDAQYGRDLPDRDNLLIDPYLKVKAYDINGVSHEKRTETVREDDNPNWFQTLGFGVGMWTKFEVSVWDDDGGSDYQLPPYHIEDLPPILSTSSTGVRINGDEGYIVIDYSYEYNYSCE
jgi:hypothetical protein